MKSIHTGERCLGRTKRIEKRNEEGRKKDQKIDGKENGERKRGKYDVNGQNRIE